MEKWLVAKCSHFLVITQGNLDHLFSYAAGNGRDQKSDLALQASCPEGLKKVRGGGQSFSPLLPLSLSLSLLCFSPSPPTHTHTVDAHRCTHRDAYCRHRQADREEKVDGMILFGGTRGRRGRECRWYTIHCYIVVQSNDSERTRHISMQPPSTQHALLPRSSGTTL